MSAVDINDKEIRGYLFECRFHLLSFDVFIMFDKRRPIQWANCFWDQDHSIKLWQVLSEHDMFTDSESQINIVDATEIVLANKPFCIHKHKIRLLIARHIIESCTDHFKGEAQSRFDPYLSCSIKDFTEKLLETIKLEKLWGSTSIYTPTRAP